MNAYQTWKSAVDFWTVMAQAPAVVTLRMMDMTRRQAARRPEPAGGSWLAPVEAVVASEATVLPFARAETAPTPEPVEEPVAAVDASEPVMDEPQTVEAVVEAVSSEAPAEEHVPAEILAEASPLALVAATEAVVEEPALFVAEDTSDEALAVLVDAEPQNLVEAAIQPILRGEAEPELAEAAAEAIAAPVGGRMAGRRGPASRRGVRPKRVN